MNYSSLVETINNVRILYPKHSALVLSNKIFTYEELFNTAKFWAITLLKTSNQKKLKRVAIFSTRDATSYIGVLSALMTGAAFIPINPKFPFSRNAYILEQCKVDAIVTNTGYLNQLKNISNHVKLPNVVILTDNLINENNSNFENILDVDQNIDVNFTEISPNDDAYILFTSGSTGNPKGVPIKHKSVCRFIKHNQLRYNITPNDRLSQTFELTFDLSIFDIFMAWCHGACLFAMQSIDLVSPIKYINDNKLTVWFSVPSVISLLNKQNFIKNNIFPSLRLSLFCGEPISDSNMMIWSNAAPNSICENLYGPTELTIACSVYQWQKNANNIIYNNIVSIGTIYPFLDFIIIDEQNNLVEYDIIGELCIGGNLYFENYLSLNEDNVSHFIYKNNRQGLNCKYYKTGDMVKLDISGNLLFHGRKDKQIKINGYRVDLSEIEVSLQKLEYVEKSCVFFIENKIMSYIVGSTSPEQVKNELMAFLPYYMIPSQIIITDNIPLNVNGKVDIPLLKNKLLSLN